MSLTSANAVIMFSVATVFVAPQQLEQFDADDIFTTGQLKSAELKMGVDGVLTGGFVFVPVEQDYTLQADSPSCDIFDAWYSAQQVAKSLFTASATITLPAIGKKYSMATGFLTGYQPAPDAKRILQARKFQVTWRSMNPSPV